MQNNVNIPQIQINSHPARLSSPSPSHSSPPRPQPLPQPRRPREPSLEERFLVCRRKLSSLRDFEENIPDQDNRITVDATALYYERLWLQRDIQKLLLDIQMVKTVGVGWLHPGEVAELGALEMQVAELFEQACKQPPQCRKKDAIAKLTREVASFERYPAHHRDLNARAERASRSAQGAKAHEIKARAKLMGEGIVKFGLHLRDEVLQTIENAEEEMEVLLRLSESMEKLDEVE